MDRPIIYPLENPAVEDLLYGWQRTLVSISKLAMTVLGPSPFGAWLEGFALTPSGGLSVQLATGQIYAQASIDASYYGVLPPDTNQILRQYILDSVSTFTLAAPTVSGQSQTWLVQIAPLTQDTGEQVLQYFDISNPEVAFGGQGNTGVAQGTIRQDTCAVTAISGAPGPTGSQEFPALSGGAIGGYYVTIAEGQTTITAADISVVPNAAPFISLKLPYTAGVDVSNSFSAPQTFQDDVTFQAGASVSSGFSAGYLFSPTTGSYLFNLGTKDSSSNVVLRSDGANVHIYPWGVPYGTLQFGANKAFNVSFNGNLSGTGTLTVSSSGSFGGTVSGANAAANSDFVTKGQLPSLLPALPFSSFNVVTSTRGLGVLYTNSTGKPMFVSVVAGGPYQGTLNNSIYGYVNGNLVSQTDVYASVGGNLTGTVALMVPPGATYQVNMGDGPLISWTETY